MSRCQSFMLLLGCAIFFLATLAEAETCNKGRSDCSAFVSSCPLSNQHRHRTRCCIRRSRITNPTRCHDSLLCFKKKDDSITATVTTVSTPPSPHLNQQQMYPVPQGGYFPSNPENHQHTAQPSKQQQQYPTTSSPYPEAVPYKPSSGPQQQYPHRDTNGPPPYTDKVQASAPPM
eukprot:gene9730-1933_t